MFVSFSIFKIGYFWNNLVRSTHMLLLNGRCSFLGLQIPEPKANANKHPAMYRVAGKNPKQYSYIVLQYLADAFVQSDL